MDTKYISVQEAVEATGYHADYIRKLIRQGEISADKKGSWWIHVESLNAYKDAAAQAAKDDKRYGSK